MSGNRGHPGLPEPTGHSAGQTSNWIAYNPAKSRVSFYWAMTPAGNNRLGASSLHPRPRYIVTVGTMPGA